LQDQTKTAAQNNQAQSLARREDEMKPKQRNVFDEDVIWSG